MSPIARNKTIITPEVFKESYDYLTGSSYRSILRKLSYFITLILIVSFVYVIGNGLPVFFFFTEAIFLGALLFYLSYYLPNTNKKRAYNRLTLESGEAPWRSYIFYSDYLVATLPNACTKTYYYSEISKIRSSKNIIILITSENQNILIDKNGFSDDSHIEDLPFYSVIN